MNCLLVTLLLCLTTIYVWVRSSGIWMRIRNSLLKEWRDWSHQTVPDYWGARNFCPNIFKPRLLKGPPPGKCMKDIATLSFILDSQLNWESGKLQLERCIHGATKWLFFLTEPATGPPDHMDVRLSRKLEFVGCLVLLMSCGVPTPIVHSNNKVCTVSPPPRICYFPIPIVPHQESMCSVPVYFFLCGVSP